MLHSYALTQYLHQSVGLRDDYLLITMDYPGYASAVATSLIEFMGPFY